MPTPPYLTKFVDGDIEECSGLTFQVIYDGKVLYVGLGGGKLGEEDGDIQLTPVGQLVLDLLLRLPVSDREMRFAEIKQETAENDETLVARVDSALSAAPEGSRVLILGDFRSALDGKISPLLKVEGVVSPDALIKVSKYVI
jgi:hypothetical protein